MADMIKFFKGLEASLPTTGVNGALYITTDEGAIYLGTGTGMKRLGDFVQVDNVASLPEKAHESCLYYCVAENILAKWNGTEWKQINKQPTAEEMKTLLGLGSMAYVSEVGEANLSEELAAKVNASAEGNHSHANKDLLDTYTQTEANLADAVAKKHTHAFSDEAALNGITAAKVADWDDAVSKEHTHTFVDTDVEDAIAKKHAHTFVESELNKIVAGDVAKWNGVVADHLTSADKTAIEDSIGDVNTALENYKTSNNEALAGVKATADAAATKVYTDEELAKKVAKTDYEADKATFATKTELGDVDAKFANYNTTTAQKAIDDAQDAEIAKKVDKVDGKSLVDDAEITKLAGVSEGANKVEASTTNGNIKIDGVETTVYTHPAKHSITDIEGLQDALDGKQGSGDFAAEDHKHTKEDITDFAHAHTASEITDFDATVKAYDYATKTEAQGYVDTYKTANDKALADEVKAREDAVAGVQGEVDALETYVGTFTASEGVDTVVKYIDAKTANIASDETVGAIDERVKAIEDDYLVEADKTELSNAIAAEKERAEGIEAGLRTDVDAIKGDYLKAADKTELEGKIQSNADAIELLTNGVDSETVDGVNDLIQYVKDHGTEVTGIKADIAANAKAIADQATSDAATYETKDDASAKLTEAKGYTDTAKAAVIGTADDASTANTVYGAKKYAEEKATAAKEAAEATAAGALASAKTELEGKITDGDAATLASAEAKVAELAGNVYTKTEVDTAVEAAKTDASNKDAVVLAEAQAYADQAEADAVAAAEGKVNALAGNVYAKTETYTQEEVDAAIEAAVTAATEWGSF